MDKFYQHLFSLGLCQTALFLADRQDLPDAGVLRRAVLRNASIQRVRKTGDPKDKHVGEEKR